MSETVYIKTDKNIEVSKRMVLIGDVADVYCNNKKMENDIKHICLIIDRKSTRLNSSHNRESRMPSSA